VDYNGSFEYSNIAEVDLAPSVYSLYQNYPNPFNPVTKIKLTIPDKEIVSLKVFDIVGEEVATLLNEEKPAGIYTIDFNGAALSGGVYLYQMKAGGFIQTKKMILLK
jgi:hypothetical protein